MAVITDGKKRPRWLIDIEVFIVLVYQSLASLAVHTMMGTFSFFFSDIMVPLPARTEFLLNLHYNFAFVYFIPPAITAVLAAYYFWKRREEDFDPSKILFCITLCSILHTLLIILFFMLLVPVCFDVF